VSDRPQWYTVRGGSREYVKKIVAGLHDARLNTPVQSVRRLPGHTGPAGVVVLTAQGAERFDDVVMACHSDQALALLHDASPAERELLGAVRYQANEAVLHTDTAVLPRRRLAWAAWNYERAAEDGQEQARVCLHYLINRLQPLPWQTPVIVSLNPARPIAPQHVVQRFEYAHPVFDSAAIAAQRRLHTLQGRDGLWFCGAWTRYGFHEDGLMSGQQVAQELLAQAALRPQAAAA
jgi:predicted NAD/FAD-binding protein